MKTKLFFTIFSFVVLSIIMGCTASSADTICRLSDGCYEEPDDESELDKKLKLENEYIEEDESTNQNDEN